MQEKLAAKFNKFSMYKMQIKQSRDKSFLLSESELPADLEPEDHAKALASEQRGPEHKHTSQRAEIFYHFNKDYEIVD